MSSIPADLKYTDSHEWVRREPDGTLTMGITDHAQEALGDLVFIELPEVGTHVAARKPIIVVESVKPADPGSLNPPRFFEFLEGVAYRIG